MVPSAQNAYDAFLHTGKISDYLDYIDLKQRPENAAGETIAYYDRRDCAAGTADRGP